MRFERGTVAIEQRAIGIIVILACHRSSSHRPPFTVPPFLLPLISPFSRANVPLTPIATLLDFTSGPWSG